MAGYLVACVTWHDTDAVNDYGNIVVESLRPFQGKYLARGAPVAAVEGNSSPKRLAIVEFPTADAARRWHASSEYAPALKIRQQHATTHWIVIMDGSV